MNQQIEDGRVDRQQLTRTVAHVAIVPFRQNEIPPAAVRAPSPYPFFEMRRAVAQLRGQHLLTEMAGRSLCRAAQPSTSSQQVTHDEA